MVSLPFSHTHTCTHTPIQFANLKVMVRKQLWIITSSYEKEKIQNKNMNSSPSSWRTVHTGCTNAGPEHSPLANDWNGSFLNNGQIRNKRIANFEQKTYSIQRFSIVPSQVILCCNNSDVTFTPICQVCCLSKAGPWLHLSLWLWTPAQVLTGWCSRLLYLTAKKHTIKRKTS